jgi:hypothetical protein
LYLATKPKEEDAQAAQARIFAIQAEKQNAADAKAQHERELASKYVSGGAQRVTYADKDYQYRVPEEEPYTANVFNMSDGALVAVLLDAQVKGGGDSGEYGGDKVGVCNLSEWRCSAYPLGTLNGRVRLGSHSYTVSVSSQPNAIVTVTDGQASIAVPVDLLYRGRALHSESYQCGGNPAPCIKAGGGQRWRYLYFKPEVRKAAQDPSVDPVSLVPDRVAVGGNN